PFQRILIDAPCSGTGVIRRQPDIKWHRRAADMPALVEQQRALLDALWPLLADGGRLVYATCSVLQDENARQIDAFLARHRDAVAIDPALPVGRRSGHGWQILPGEGDMDGFFHAVLARR
ncbi:MAG: 16S rRNA (cytosine(967)-C(5))-methyltransferase RsmB, partial [Xanthomonadales bacterium]|nr:16S rRNA (cytosine(967)-C(5))-methyltransferase RsmB [Xanthomonadales bacterium]